MFNRAKLREYHVWKQMRQRCKNKNNKDYAWYGGRGITVCEEWDDFLVFLRDMGMRPSDKHTLERKNNDAGYGAENCCWETRTSQMNNTRSIHWICFKDKRMSITAWAREVGIARTTIAQRLVRGWFFEKAISTPAHNRRRKK